MTSINYKDVQGLVFSGYRKMPYASYFLLKINNPTAIPSWLEELLAENIISDGESLSGTTRVNIAFSSNGLKELNFSDSELNTFDPGFREGMSSARRTKVLGDSGVNDPSHWQWGGEKSVDLVLMLFCQDKSEYNDKTDSFLQRFQQLGLDIVKRLEATPNPHMTDGEKKLAKEHFGFADGISQPEIEGFPKFSRASVDNTQPPPVTPGEFLLGYKNEYDRVTRVPENKSLGERFGINGSYLVFRQLEQDVDAFWNYMAESATKYGVDATWVASKMVGRWPNGTLILPDDKAESKAEPNNNFDFLADPDGIGCPLGSHIRRNNPRSTELSPEPDKAMEISNRHRLLRRGRNYGDPVPEPGQAAGDGKERGLLFLCLNANIERQFEFLQHSWLNNTKFPGLYDEDDPVMGIGISENKKFSIPAHPCRLKLSGFDQFVTTRGGEYFFLPSMSALAELAKTD